MKIAREVDEKRERERICMEGSKKRMEMDASQCEKVARNSKAENTRWRKKEETNLNEKIM